VKQQQLQQCDDRLEQLVGDIFRGNEMVPDIIDRPPPHHLDLTFRYVEEIFRDNEMVPDIIDRPPPFTLT
jgi:hypothetical protein